MLSPRAMRIARVRGVPVVLDPGLVLALAFFAWSQVDHYRALATLSEILPIQMSLPPAAWAVVLALALAVGVALHATAQALVAHAAGADVRRVTLSLFGGRCRLLAPGRGASVEWRVALAGPLVSAGYGLIALALSTTFRMRHADVHMVLFDLGKWQLVFAGVQLLPAFPFDGGRAVRAVVSRRIGVLAATRLVAAIGGVAAIACLTYAITAGKSEYLFLALFLFAGAAATPDDDAIASALAGQRARDAMVIPVGLAPAHAMCGEIAGVLARSQVSALPIVAESGALLGAVALPDLRRVRRTARWITTLAELLPTLGGVVAADAPLDLVRRRMRRRRAAAAAVVGPGGRLEGVVTLRGIDRRVQIGELVADDRARFRLEPPTA